MSGNDNRGARPSIPEVLESRDIIVTRPHDAPDASAGDVSTHTRIKVEELKDAGLVNTQESLFNNEFWNVVNTPYPVDTSNTYRAHTHYQAAIPYPKDRLTSFHEDIPFRAHTRYHAATEGNIRNPRSYSISVQSNAN